MQKPVTISILILSLLVLAGCSTPEFSNGGGPENGDAGSAYPPSIEVQACPQALIDYHVSDGDVPASANDIPALSLVDLAPSCIFEGKDLTNASYYWVYYVTDRTNDLVTYLNAAYLTVGVKSQEVSTTGGTWDLAKDGTVGAEIGTASNDSKSYPLIGSPYIWMFIG